MLKRTHFKNIEEFLGIRWIEEGCERLNEDIERMLNQQMVDTWAEDRAHPIHQLWHNFILDRPLPSDLIRGKFSHIDHSLGQIHRFLTVEYLLNALRPSWEDEVATDIRNKLRHQEQFASTLYELDVADNFRRFGL